MSVGKTLYQSARWKTFPDFLGDYIRRILYLDAGNTEIAKPFGERHPIVQWYDTYCRYQRTYIHTPGVVGYGVVTVGFCLLPRARLQPLSARSQC